MKKISFLISCFALFSCDPSSVFSSQKSSHAKLDSSTPKIYFNDSNHFEDIASLNRESKTLGLYDQIVLLNETEFLKNKEKSFFNLEPVEIFINKKEDIKIKLSSFCSQSQTNLSNSQNRMFQELASDSSHSSLSIIDLIPKAFLLEHLDKEFYCTFILSIRDKSKEFTHYTLTQQSIQANFSNKQKNPLSLVQETLSGYEHTPINYTLNKSNIKTAFLLNNSNEKITSYEMFCNGKQVMNIPRAKMAVSSIFSHLINIPDLPKGLQRCFFFSKNNNRVIGLTVPFRLDFDGLDIKNKPIDLIRLGYPSFVDTSEKPIDPSLIKAGSQLKRKAKHIQHTKEEYLFTFSLFLNAYIHFKDLNEILPSRDINSIEMIIQTQCLDTNFMQYFDTLFSYAKLFDINGIGVKTARVPLREKTPIAIALPSNIFEIGLSFDHWLRKLIIVQELFGIFELMLSEKLKNKKRLEIMDSYFFTKINSENRLRQIKHQITCLYTIKLEDKNNPQNKREFEPKPYRIVWSRNPYGVSYTAFHNGQNPFITPSQQAYKYNSKDSIHFKSKMGYLSLTFSDLMESSNLRKENYGLESFSLFCRDLINREFNLSWPYNSIINNQIVLKDLFDRPEFQDYMNKYKENQVNCRVLFYGQNGLLKYFSGEIRLHNMKGNPDAGEIKSLSHDLNKKNPKELF